MLKAILSLLKSDEEEFLIESNSPLCQVGDVHEDNHFFHGTKFEVTAITSVQPNPNPNSPWKYLIKGHYKVLGK